jgi:hypothetical protein
MNSRGWDIKGHRNWIDDSEEVLITYNGEIVRFSLEPWPAGAVPHPTIGGMHETLRQTREWQQDGNSTFLRAALNAAWGMGMRPDGFEDTRESMKATNKHLEDMRAITFGKLGVTKP